jgi:predicted transcriptional regulator
MTDTREPEVLAAKPKNKGGRPRGAKRAVGRLTQGELATAVVDFAKGIPQREIATKLGVSESAISTVLDKFKPAFSEIANVEEYRKVKSEILDSVSLATLKQLSNQQRLDEAPLNQLAYTFDIIAKHSRLEQGKATALVGQQIVNISLTPGEYSEPA